MTIESNLRDALKALVGNRVFPDVAPLSTARPYITFQQVGGQAAAFMEGGVVGKRNARFQVNCWADDRQAAADLARSVEDTLVTDAVVRAQPLGAMAAQHEQETRNFGTRQDFSVWY